jgi:DNA helicase-2/ATP-dependent DNA helicase PcrA
MDLNKLNREQRCAAETLQGPVLILAGAGSGKTRALTYRLANLIDHGVPSYKILALTFTNKAAKEMKKRVADLIGQKEADDAWISTFHSTCARILRRDIEKLGYNRSFAIYDDDDQNRVMKEILKKLNIDENFISTREIRGKISDGSDEILTSIRAGYVSYIINTRAILSGIHYEDGAAIRREAIMNGVTMFTSLDTVRIVLEVLEDITPRIRDI